MSSYLAILLIFLTIEFAWAIGTQNQSNWEVSGDAFTSGQRPTIFLFQVNASFPSNKTKRSLGEVRLVQSQGSIIQPSAEHLQKPKSTWPIKSLYAKRERENANLGFRYTNLDGSALSRQELLRRLPASLRLPKSPAEVNLIQRREPSTVQPNFESVTESTTATKTTLDKEASTVPTTILPQTTAAFISFIPPYNRQAPEMVTIPIPSSPIPRDVASEIPPIQSADTESCSSSLFSWPPSWWPWTQSAPSDETPVTENSASTTTTQQPHDDTLLEFEPILIFIPVDPTTTTTPLPIPYLNATNLLNNPPIHSSRSPTENQFRLPLSKIPPPQENFRLVPWPFPVNPAAEYHSNEKGNKGQNTDNLRFGQDVRQQIIPQRHQIRTNLPRIDSPGGLPIAVRYVSPSANKLHSF